MRTHSWMAGVAAPLLALATGVACAQDATLLQATALLAEPAPKAAEVAKLPANTPLTIVERKGCCYHVKGPGGEDGWVKLMAVRLAAGARVRPAAGAQASSEANTSAVRQASSGSLGGAAASAIDSSMTGSSADSTAIRGTDVGKLSGKQLIGPAKSRDGSVEKMGDLEPSDKDMEDFEKGLDNE